MFIPLNTAAYSPNTLNKGSPTQANQTTNRGFFSAPSREPSGKLLRTTSSTFADVWSQPRLFFNSLLPTEQQFVINAIRFELSNLKSAIVKQNVLIQLNRISHDIAVRVATAIGFTAPAADPKYYHNNKTKGVSVFEKPLLKLDGLKVALLTSQAAATTNSYNTSLTALKTAFAAENVDLVVVAEAFVEGIDATYTLADATAFDGIIVSDGAKALFSATSKVSTLYPVGRPLQVLQEGFRYGKPIGAVGDGSEALKAAGIVVGDGVVVETRGAEVAKEVLKSLRGFKVLSRFALDA
jgi:catalase